MVTRLIQRGSRLLAASIFCQPLPAATLPECVRLCQIMPTFLPRVALHTTSLCRLAGSLPGASQDSVAQDDNEFFALLSAAPDVNDLLKISSQHEISGNKGAMIIQQIFQRKDLNKQELLNDQRFQMLLDNVGGQIQYVWSFRLIGLLKSLYLLGLDHKSHCLQSVENEVRWRLRRMNIRILAQLSSFVSSPGRSKEEKAMVDDLVRQVELRWTEIRETRSLVTLVSKLGHMSNTLMEVLEDKVLEFAEQFTPEESRKVMLALAFQQRRTLPVLRVLSFHLAQHKSELPPSVVIDLAFAYARLSFCQTQVLQRMTADLLPSLPTVSSMDIARIIRSFASLKFFSLPFCEAITQTYLQQTKSFSTLELCAVLQGFALLNFQPSQSEEFFSMVHQRLSSELDSLNSSKLLDVVWSLCVLDQVTAPYLQKVLDSQFYSKLLEEISTVSISQCLKLLHINTTAQLEESDYQGPLLPGDIIQTVLQRIENQNLSSFQSGVRDMLKVIFPESGTCGYNVQTVYGWILDGEVVLDSENKALPLKDFVSPHSLKSEGTQPLPEDTRRFAIVCREFSNYSFRSKDLLGRYAMNRRHLRAAGFVLVEVPYYDWQDLKSDWQKQSFLKDQIKKALAEEMTR